jgi:hypothetical protein
MSINLRLQEIFGAEEFFGGRCVVLFGDLLQLPPVHGKRPFEELSGDDMHNLTGGLRIPCHLWHHFQYDELTINQRQKGHKNEKWNSMLGRIRIGRPTQDDIESLQERIIPITKCDLPRLYLEQIVQCFLTLQKEHPSIVCLLPKRDMMDSFNAFVMKTLFPDAVEVTAIDEVDGKTKADRRRASDAVSKIDRLGDSRNTADLEKSLLLCEGVRIMLRKNIDTARGLVNGAMGTVRQLVRSSDNLKSPVETLIVQFDGIEGDVAISRDVRKIKLFEQSFLHRHQFPISVGYGLTIHKAQGMSLDHVFCDLGSTIFATGQIYVALSRCKSLEGLHLINFDDTKIKVDPLALREYIRLNSKPIRDAGITTFNDVQSESNNKGKRKRVGNKKDRIWYDSETAKKAKATLKEHVGYDTEPKKGKGKKKSTKMPMNDLDGKNKKPKSSKHGNESCLTASNIGMFVNHIHEGIPDEHIPTTDIINGAEMNLVYRRALVPCHRSTSQDTFILRTARELDPDPLNERRGNSLWLTGTTILRYIAVIKDDMAEIGGPTIYNMGPYCSTYRSASRFNIGQIKQFIKNTFSERPFTRVRLVLHLLVQSLLHNVIMINAVCL